jgi:predicted lipid-binding transport protein (Tim44 family)
MLRFWIFILAVCAPNPAYAYLDPGTGSMILQLLLGGVAGVLIIGKLYWQLFTDLFAKRKQPLRSDKE